MNTDLHFATGNNVRETPQDFFDELDAEFGFGWDVAALSTNTKCMNYMGPDHVNPGLRDCLSIDWSSDRPNWLNPPYGEEQKPCKENCKKFRCLERKAHVTEYTPGCYQFIEKAAQQRKKGVTTVCLLAARTDTAWFHDFVWDTPNQIRRDGVEIRYIRGRLKFDNEENSAPFPSMLVIFHGD